VLITNQKIIFTAVQRLIKIEDTMGKHVLKTFSETMFCLIVFTLANVFLYFLLWSEIKEIDHKIVLYIK